MHSAVRFVRENPHGESGGVAQTFGCHGQMPSDEQKGAHCAALVALALRLKISSSLNTAHSESVQRQSPQQASVRLVVEKPQGASGLVGQSEGAHDQMPSLAHVAAQRSAPVPSELPSGSPVTDVVQRVSVQLQSCQQAVVKFVVENPQGAGGAVGLGMAELDDEELDVGLAELELVVVQFLGNVGQIPACVHSCPH
jgi:hypothetical protein